MTIKTRRLIYITFFIIFFVVVPILTLYATGYRYNFKKNRIEKTGVLIVESIPKKSDIYLNDKFAKKTPTRLNHLLPDEYKLTVSKDGYYDWTKKVTVRSGMSTFATDIVLFKKLAPILIEPGEINILAGSPDQQKIIYSKILDNSQEEMRLFNINGGTNLLVKTLNSKSYDRLDFVSWSPDSKKILIKKPADDFNNYLIIDVTNLEVKELFDITRLNFSKLKFDQNNSTILYGLTGSTIYKIDLINNTVTDIIASHITDFLADKNDLFYISQVAEETFLNHSQINQNQNPVEKIKLSPLSQYNLEVGPNDYLYLLDQKNNDLFVIEKRAFTSQDIANNIILQNQAKQLFWQPGNQKIIFSNGFDVWDYDFSTNQINFINRYGQPIENAIWLLNKPYLVYQINDEIHITETAPGNTKNDYLINKCDGLDGLFVDYQAQNLYFKCLINNQPGIYKLNIQ
ncbi:MAG: PEGA domain-containing protein [Candidatus Buchananbacteria bacterium]|nr:PEGA domain-containing protein [Candidatus Buchananbacteria bacterium]